MRAVLAILAAFLFLTPGLSGAQAAWNGSTQVISAGPRAVVRDGPVEARLASGQAGIRPGQPFTVALVLTMDPGWHTYWKFPGESGLPTTVQWDLPPGFSAGPIEWPTPERFVSQGLVTYGYPGTVLLLSEITPPVSLPRGPVTIKARAGWLACRVECTPGKANLQLSLPAGAGATAADAATARAFADARAQLPAPGPASGISVLGDADSLTLSVSSIPLAEGEGLQFYPSSPGPVRVSAPQQVSREPASVKIRLQREPGSGLPARLAGLLVVTGPAAPRSFEIDVPVSAAASAASGAGLGLLAALLLAFAGGIILNLMPCVLPVLSLKALSFLKAGSGGGLRSGLQFTLGVLVSFWIIAAVLEALRAGGRLLGWGFQFQDPVVVLVTAVLFFLIGLNLFGVFEVGTLLTRLGGGPRARGGAGSFLTGVFATAVATPCTAPFMGAAVGYALSHSAAASIGVFTALGLGMAAPSLALYALPGLARRLPKPGPWMETFRQVMAFPMMAAAVWMASVLASLSGSGAVVALLAAALTAGLGAWIWGRWGTLSRRTAVRAAAGSLALLLAVGSTGAAAWFLPRQADPPAAAAAPRPAADRPAAWEPWSAQRLEDLRKAGTPVFVDFTARWCLTCLVNERVALESPAVRSRFKEAGVATLRADWTDTNDEIARALGSFGRASVPLYVFYPGGGRDPVILPEVLTPGIVLAALKALD